MLQMQSMYSNNDNLFNMSHPILDSDVSKFMNGESIDYMQPAATSPVQESLMAPYYPQQQHQNQRQHQIQFPAPTTVPHSAPSSPPFQVKTEEPQQHNMDLFLLQNSFESTQDHHILQSQRSPQMNLQIIHQHQQHQQKQHQQHQQLRLQQQQQQFQQQQMMFETSHSTATTMSIPAASIMVSSASYAPSTIATTTPFFHPSSISHDDTHTVPTLGYQQRLNAYTPAAHPAAPKRKIEERQSSPIHSVDTAVAVSAKNLVISEESSYPSMKSSAAISSRLSTSSRLDKVKPTRSTKISKSTPSSSSASSSEMIAAVANKKTTKKASESRESSEQPENNESTPRVAGTGNVTHPRRAAQNRAAQRTFRNRRKAYIKELEQKVQEIDQTRELMESIHQENQEVWRRLQILENLVRKHELPVPDFAPLIPNTVSNMDFLGNALGGSNVNANANDGLMAMMALGGSSNEEDEDEGDMSDSFSQLQYQQ
ncbi:hypothetical protein BGZ79_010212 [Entomortierella chlamydospora]|nr:hypothetical protein BGZ79_010212 [Entomortierella chlamydospora]